MRVLMAAAAAAALFAAGCTAGPGHTAASPGHTAAAPGHTAASPAHTAASPGHTAASPAPLPPDPRTAPALLKIAARFNHEYDSGDYGPVYARWDARSQAIITRAGYIRRHRDCPGAPSAPSVTESADPGPHGAWLVHYEIGGQQLTDYWFYVHRRWVFDLVLSNPSAVTLYKLSPGKYAATVGCSH
jgi:hypothetical protein